MEIHCSAELCFFPVLSVHAHRPAHYHELLRSCRTLGVRGRQGRGSLLVLQQGFTWSKRMSCDGLRCWAATQRSCAWITTAARTPLHPQGSCQAHPTPNPPGPGLDLGSERATARSPSVYKCPQTFMPILKESYLIYNKVLTGQVPNCAVPCYQSSFSPDE